MQKLLKTTALVVFLDGSGQTMAAAPVIEDLLDRKAAARKTWRS
jgi:hypothetical protein